MKTQQNKLKAYNFLLYFAITSSFSSYFHPFPIFDTFGSLHTPIIICSYACRVVELYYYT